MTKAESRPPITDQWVDATYIARRFCFSLRTAYRWIDKLKELTGDEVPAHDHRFKRKKRPTRLRRISLRVLEEHLDELLNH